MPRTWRSSGPVLLRARASALDSMTRAGAREERERRERRTELVVKVEAHGEELHVEVGAALEPDDELGRALAEQAAVAREAVLELLELLGGRRAEVERGGLCE